MKSIITSMAVAAGLMIAGSAMAVDMPPEAKSGACAMCHAIDHKIMGPAWKDVAVKYKDDKNAAKTISASITKGLKDDPYWKAKGIMGQMPAKGNAGKATDAEIEALGKFIAALK